MVSLSWVLWEFFGLKRLQVSERISTGNKSEKAQRPHIIAQTSSVPVSRSWQLPFKLYTWPPETLRRTLLKNGEYACIQNEQRTYVVWKRVLSLVCLRWGCTWLSTFYLQYINAFKPQICPRVCLGAKRHVTNSFLNCLEACNGLTLLFLLLSSFSFHSHDGPQWSPAIKETWLIWAAWEKHDFIHLMAHLAPKTPINPSFVCSPFPKVRMNMLS